MGTKNKIILISGYLRTGKDTFYSLLETKCLENDILINGHSFAHALKEDLYNIVAQMGIDIHNPTDEQKTLIRPLMIIFGCIWREIDLLHWVKIVDSQITHCPLPVIGNFYHVIRDNRFINETNYFIEKYGRENVIIVEIKRKDAPTPTKEELENQPEISAIADFVIDWPTVGGNVGELMPYVTEFYEKYIK